jgi:hypothetical protein
MVMPEGLSIRGHVHELRFRPAGIKPGFHVSEELLAVRQQFLEGNALCRLPVVEEQGDFPP